MQSPVSAAKTTVPARREPSQIQLNRNHWTVQSYSPTQQQCIKDKEALQQHGWREKVKGGQRGEDYRG